MKRLGFTLIELIIVIALIGVLAATALPRFANLSDQAHDAVAKSVAGSLGAAVAIAHAKWLAAGNMPTILLEEQTVVMSKTGWPEAVTGTPNGIVTPAKCVAVWEGVLRGAPPAAIDKCEEGCQFLVKTSDSSTCQFVDQQGRGDNIINYNITTGLVAVTNK